MPSVVTDAMIEAGRARLAELTNIILTQGELSAIYLAMTQASPPPNEMVERVAELIADHVAFRRWEEMAEDRADLRLKMRGGNFDVNEPSKADCREAARAALKSIGIEDQG